MATEIDVAVDTSAIAFDVAVSLAPIAFDVAVFGPVAFDVSVATTPIVINVAVDTAPIVIIVGEQAIHVPSDEMIWTDYAPALFAAVAVPVNDLTWADYEPIIGPMVRVEAPTDSMLWADYAPEIEAEPVIEGYSFTMTAGDFAGVLTGYISADAGGPTGSIDAEPLPGFTLNVFYVAGAGGQIGFDGDAMALVAGKTVWVDGVNYPFDAADWSTDGTFTAGGWESAAPSVAALSAYFIEIK